MNAYSQAQTLSILTHAPADAVKLLAEMIIPQLGVISVLTNRIGLVMLPYTDSSQGTLFHLGEVLVTESQVQIENGAQGYAVCMGRDLEHSLAVALLDAAITADIQREALLAFVVEQERAQVDADNALLRAVEATRIEMETF